MLFFDSGLASAQPLNYYVVKVGDKVVGTSNSRQKAEEALADARILLSKQADSIVYVNTELSLEQEDRYFAPTDSKETLCASMYDYLEEKVNLDYIQGYMIASGEYTLIVDSIDSVAVVLETLENSYDNSGKYNVCLQSIEEGNFSGITYDISKVESKTAEADIPDSKDAASEETTASSKEGKVVSNKVNTVMANADGQTASSDTHNLEAVGFTDDLEIHPVYVDSSVILSADEAIEQLNSDGADAIGVVMTEVVNYDEKYYAETEYVDDDSMYQGESKVVQEAVPGVRNVTARINYVNGWESSRDYLDEQILKAATAEVVHVGTQVAPTFVVPVDGVFTSGFGARWGTVHEGNDYGCPYASPIWASCGGTVTYSGWNNGGYGNMVVIDHGNGLSTRYAHMCQVGCYVGQKVEQFEVIGYAGNTGDSFGVHCHFEIMVNEVPVDPFTYLN